MRFDCVFLEDFDLFCAKGSLEGNSHFFFRHYKGTLMHKFYFFKISNAKRKRNYDQGGQRSAQFVKHLLTC